MAEAAKPIYMFYHLQGERGESPAHPNACKLSCATPGKVTLADVLASFPLVGTSSFHFRFQVNVDKQIMFVDLSNPDDTVPVFNGSVIAKILRLDNAKCASRLTENLGLRLRQTQPGPRAPSQQQQQQQPRGGAPPRGDGPSSSSSSGGAGARPAAIRTPSGGAAAAPSSLSSPSPGAASTSSGRASVTGVAAAVTPEPPVVVPDEVDADLEGKSDYVKARVMERRAELRRAQEARLAEVAERDRAAACEQEERDAFKATYDGPLAAWSSEPGGAKKNIRTLLASLHTVLWEGAKWEPLPLSKLVMAPKVKFFFMRAITIVHPDKHNTMDAAQKYVATNIFHALETAYRTFQETET